MSSGRWLRDLEGPWDQVSRVIGYAHTLIHQEGIPRIQTDIRMTTRWAGAMMPTLGDWSSDLVHDYRTDKEQPMEGSMFWYVCHSLVHVRSLSDHGLRSALEMSGLRSWRQATHNATSIPGTRYLVLHPDRLTTRPNGPQAIVFNFILSRYLTHKMSKLL